VLDMVVNKITIPKDIWPKRVDWKGRVVEIYVNKGDRVSVGEPLLDIEIEKAVLSIESDVEGIVEKIYVSKGDEISPGDIVMEIREV